MTKEQEKETIKYLEFLKKEYLEDAKQRKENGEITGHGTMEDIDKLRALYIGFALNMLKEKDKEMEKKDKRINDLEYALLDMVMQFADRPNIKGSRYALNTMGLSALELAFDVLGFDDPYPVNKAEEKYKILAKQYFERKAREWLK